jgi:hypothetical protein
VGLIPDAPFVLYLCSSPFIAPNEVDFVRRWAAAIRAAGSPSLQQVGLLVRPHPQNGAQWHGIGLSELGNAAIWPPDGTQPDAGEARADYFDSLVHSACIVGINTSGLIEAGIVGKSVLTVLDEDFAGTQAGTLHFQYLRWENGGLLRVARNLDEHLVQLGRALEQGPEDAEHVRQFVTRFCRPHGLDRPAAALVAAGVEELGRLAPPTPSRPTAGTIGLRAALYPIAVTMTGVSSLSGGLRRFRKFLQGAATRLRGGVRNPAESLDSSA